MSKLFDPLVLRQLTLKNRIAMSPMCMYSAGEDGLVDDWHIVHYATRAAGGVGLIIVEATAVEARGRISEQDLGIYNDRQVAGLAKLATVCHAHGAKIGIQLAHAGRKAWSENMAFGKEQPVAPSPIPFDADWNVPDELSEDEIAGIVGSFRAAARRALRAGFDVIELHAAHGYLISEFLSPLANKRSDQYGGDAKGRIRLLHEVIAAVREEWPAAAPLFVRISCSDYVPGGIDVKEAVAIAQTLQQRGVDLVDCSSGAVLPVTVAAWPGYQIPFAHRIKREAAIPTAAVGLITAPEMADEIVRNQRADLVVLGRELLRNPYWALDAAKRLGKDVEWPVQYMRAKR